MSKRNANSTLQSLWTAAGLDAAELAEVHIEGADPELPSIFRVGEAAAVTVAAAGAAAARLWALRTGESQSVSVSVRHALAAFRSQAYLLIDGEPPPSPWGRISGYYDTADGRTVQLHANFPHHHQGLVDLLQCSDDKHSVATALRCREAALFEEAATSRGLPVGAVRSRDEWVAHDQGQAVAGLPLLEIVKIGDSAPEPLPPLSSTPSPTSAGDRPLSGIRALDLSRVIAGPVCGRTLASHGASVLRIGSPNLPIIPHIWLDLARGKRSAHLDLTNAQDLARLRDLIRQTDIFSQAYRPGTLASKGLGPTQIHELRPGAVYVTLCAYSHAGPWAAHRGFDSLVQTVSGFGHAGAVAAGVDGTRPLPCQALDHATGYLAAFGAMVALRRRAEDGGSYLVRVSLAQTGQWLWNLGRVEGLQQPDQKITDVADLLEERQTIEGMVRAIRPAEQLATTPARWDLAPVPLGHDQPSWD